MLYRVGLFIILLFVVSQASKVDSLHGVEQGVNSKNVAKSAQDPSKTQISGETEGGVVDDQSPHQEKAEELAPVHKATEKYVPANNTIAVKPLAVPKASPAQNEAINATTMKILPTAAPTDDKMKVTPKNTTEPDPLEMNNPAAVKRALIVFGGFLILAIAYWVTVGRKSKFIDTSNTHINNNDSNQFRYGVLQSERGDDNMELSRIPLTMESDDEDDDDLEIFDLGQKKKSLSYVNLQMNEDDVDLSLPNDRFNERQSKSNLIDIGDSDTLINLQSDHSSKFVL